MGVAAELIAEARAHIEEHNRSAELSVWPENWHAVLIFLDMDTQWRLVPAADRLLWQGLDRSALPITMAGIKCRVPEECRRSLSELMPQLRTLEVRAAMRKNA